MGAISPHSTGTSDGPWDGDANRSRLPNSAAALRASHAWVDPDGDPDAKSSYRFIHHEIGTDGTVGKANITACSTGIGVLNGGRAGTTIPSSDKAGVHRHLAKHLTDAGREAPPLRGESTVAPVLELAAGPWAIMPEALADVRRVLAGDYSAAAEVMTPPDEPELEQAVAILPLHGVITPRASLLSMMLGGGGGLADFRVNFRAALDDPTVEAIVIDVDSPGGLVDLVPETAAEVRAARGRKPIVAVANTRAASAAYWIASAADRVYVTPSGELGSIGVLLFHEDVSKAAEMAGVKTTVIAAGRYKAEGNPFEPLDDDARDHLQGFVDELYDQFVADVAAGRGVAPKTVRDGFGQGRLESAPAAIRSGLGDKMATLDVALGELGVEVLTTQTVSAEAGNHVGRSDADRRRVLDLLLDQSDRGGSGP